MSILFIQHILPAARVALPIPIKNVGLGAVESVLSETAAAAVGRWES